MNIIGIPAGISKIEIDLQPINFSVKLWEFLLLDDSLIGLMDWSEIEQKCPELDERRCIWCFNLDGSIKWMIEPPYRLENNGDKKLITEDAFLAMKIVNGKLRAITSFGNGYDLDVETGKISNWKHHK